MNNIKIEKEDDVNFTCKKAENKIGGRLSENLK